MQFAPGLFYCSQNSLTSFGKLKNTLQNLTYPNAVDFGKFFCVCLKFSKSYVEIAIIYENLKGENYECSCI